MATKGERQALLFLAAVALLGAGTRLYRSRRPAVEESGIDRQIAAVEGARAPAARERKRKRRAEPADSPLTVGGPSPVTRVDLDVASAAEIERLPGIGPALAKRIVADREAQGPFGCLAALDAVKGIGPSLLARLDSLATFSGPGRPGCVSAGGPRPASPGPGPGESRHQ